MAGYIGSKASVAQVDGYTRTETDAEFVSDPNGAVTVDGSGNVGIGITPSYPLHVSGNAGVTGSTFVGSKFSAATPDYSFLADSSLGMFRLPNVLGFSVAGTERMRIDSSGRVTMPYQPAFSVHGVSFDSTTLSLLGPVVLTNVGGHFSTTTGRFTAPVAGVYGFSFVLSTGDANSHFVDLYKNGLLHGSRVLQYGSAYSTGANVQIIPLAAGDYVEARKRNESYAVYNAIFSGQLIG